MKRRRGREGSNEGGEGRWGGGQWTGKRRMWTIERNGYGFDTVTTLAGNRLDSLFRTLEDECENKIENAVANV